MLGQMLTFAPVLAGVFAVPQFLPQLRIVLSDADVSGVSWLWAALTSANNAAWCAYFVLSRYWTALIPGAAVTILAGALAAQLAKRGTVTPAGRSLVGAWSALVAVVAIGFGRAPLGAVLTVAFVVQVAPSLRGAYRTRHPAGISRGTWLLILAELICWGLYGIRSSDPRLITLGGLGVLASALMLLRAGPTPTARPKRQPGTGPSRSDTAGFNAVDAECTAEDRPRDGGQCPRHLMGIDEPDRLVEHIAGAVVIGANAAVFR
jgi:uncharacterized protein with PQ loop repeat